MVVAQHERQRRNNSLRLAAAADGTQDLGIGPGLSGREGEPRVDVGDGGEKGPHVNLGALGEFTVFGVQLGGVVVADAALSHDYSAVVGETRVGQLKGRVVLF